ncbi:unnamed protein product [Paramecium primaurelia]|uniref:Cyclin-like domain-containing protein n=1 Tax=Paramecium primaurelia TaxID=5886 RepID=A0A8S1P902_PARPR|nr:unnamed protein product [Paramecium primaurelia]
MQFSDITNNENSYHNLKTKSLISQKTIPASPKKKPSLNYMDIHNFKFEWICLDNFELEIMNQINCNPFQYSYYEQMQWFQNYNFHFSYPLKLDHINTQESLKRHSICELRRNNLLCWMGQVLSSYDSTSNETYFLAISIFDKFLQQYPYSLGNQELLGIGISCLSLASKQKDIYCLSSSQLIQISGEKMTEDQLAKCQFQILQTIQYQIEMPNYFKNFDYIMRDLEFRYYKQIRSNIIDNSLMKLKISAIYKCTLNLLRFVTQYYDTTIFYQSTIAYCCILYTIKRMELLNFRLLNYLSQILVQIQIDQDIMNTEIALKYIYRLCQNELTQIQSELLSQTDFKY